MDAFDDKRVLITGAASGIGAACAIELARRGARLFLADIDAIGLQRTADAVAAVGHAAETLAVDLATKEGVDRTAKEALARFSHIDVLINNAGVAVVAPLSATSEDDWAWLFDINVHAPIRLTRALLPHMIARRSGHIVMVASLAGLIGAPSMSAYSTSKFALVGFAEALRFEVNDERIAVTVVCPGYVRTNLHNATRYANPGFKCFLDRPPAWYGVSKERAARIIVSAIAARRPMVVIGLEKLGYWLKRISPRAAFALSAWAARRAGVL